MLLDRGCLDTTSALCRVTLAPSLLWYLARCLDIRTLPSTPGRLESQEMRPGEVESAKYVLTGRLLQLRSPLFSLLQRTPVHRRGKIPESQKHEERKLSVQSIDSAPRDGEMDGHGTQGVVDVTASFMFLAASLRMDSRMFKEYVT